MADGSGLSRQLDERIAHARRGLAFPAGAKAARAAAVWIFIFGVFWFSGLHDRLGEVWKAASGLTFYVGLAVTFFIGLKSWRRPSDQDARDLIGALDETAEAREVPALAVGHRAVVETPKEVRVALDAGEKFVGNVQRLALLARAMPKEERAVHLLPKLARHHGPHAARVLAGREEAGEDRVR